MLGSAQNVVNAVFIRCSASQAEEVASIPGVIRVVRDRTFRRQLNTSSEIVRGSALNRAESGGWTGKGIKIGVIDSGIDPGHPAFQNVPSFIPAGDPPPTALAAIDGYPKGRTQDIRFANNKVIAVRTYEHLLNSRDPETSTPDEDSPLDRNVHGTAVAMIAAGHAVQTPLGVQEGLAPGARIGVYKIFGTPGLSDGATSSAVIAALDDAVADGMDVLNLSIGGSPEFPWDWQSDKCAAEGPSRLCNPDAMALNSAVNDFGLVVVVAAGNSGDSGLQAQPTFNTLSEASSVPNVIVAGATVNSRTIAHSVMVNSTKYDALAGGGPMPSSPLSAPAVLHRDLSNPYGCAPFPDDDSLLERIVVVEIGDCAFSDQVENADEAGAFGVLFLNFEGEPFPADGLESTDIPAFMVGTTASEQLEGMSASSQVSIVLDPTPVAKPADSTEVAEYSSRGPTLRLNLKPDIVAPGNVYTAALRQGPQGTPYRPSGFAELEGTSFSAPIVAGAAALVWEARPEFTAREVASALINTANPQVKDGGVPASVRAIGGGLLDVGKALSAETTVVPPTVSFGSAPSEGQRLRRVITVRNRANDSQTYSMSIEPVHAADAAVVRVAGLQSASFTLGSGDFLRVPVELQVPASSTGIFEGRIRIASPDQPDLLVPYLYIAKDNLPHNGYAIPISSGVGLEGERSEDFLAARILDQYGAPVAGAPAVFSVSEGQGTIEKSDTATSSFGVATADVLYDASTELQVVDLAVGNISIPWEFYLGGGGPTISAVGMIGIPNLHERYAPGALIDIFGSGLSYYNAELVLSAPWAPVVLKGTSVSFDVAASGKSAPGRLVRVGWDSVTVQVPWELGESGTATVKVTSQLPSQLVQVGMAAVSPAILVNLGLPQPTGDGTPIGLIVGSESEFVSVSSPAGSGDTVQIFMAGNGPLTTPVPSGEAALVPIPTVHAPSCTIGGRDAPVTSSVLVPDVVGIYAVGVTVPDGLGQGMHTVQVTVGGVASNTVGLYLR